MKATPPPHTIPNRREAGKLLARQLLEFRDDADLVILALPRGGVPVAAEIAAALGKPFDLLTVRKLGVPGHEEFAMGAIASGGVHILDDALISSLGITPEQVEAVVRRESGELGRRENLYRGGRAAPDVTGRTVIIVDDGIATGSSMKAAVRLMRRRGAHHIIVAAPVAAPSTANQLREEADMVKTLMEPEPFRAVGIWYEDFSQTTDEEVRLLLAGNDRARKPASSPNSTIGELRELAIPLTGGADDYDRLLRMIGDASIVLLGEASHGTHEFYRERARITKLLIVQKGFNAVAVEADWPDAYRINRFVRGEPGDAEAIGALSGFERFPSWMWRNADVLDFIGWARDHNEQIRPPGKQVGFYGLDLYSMNKSVDEVVAYLERRDPAEAAKAKTLYGCMDRFGGDPQNYGLMTHAGISESCRKEVIRQLVDLRAKETEYMAADGPAEADEFFFAEQNARLVKSAEEYYRKMFVPGASSWNQRDLHMMETLAELIAHLRSRHGSGKVVVWAHNSHLGDARATEMGRRGELNLGQLTRQNFLSQSKLIGFSTHQGTVTAASGWHLPAERKRVRPGLEGSYENLFHEVGIPRFWLNLTDGSPAARALGPPRLQRAIGVIYRPETERQSHYFKADLAAQFDAILHLDITRAVEPLDQNEEWVAGEAPETFPVGL